MKKSVSKKFRTSSEFVSWYTERHQSLIAPSTLDYTDRLILTHAQGTRLWDTKGKEYLDCDASVAVAGIGHNHPKIAEMRIKQQERLDFVGATDRLYWFEIEVAGKKYEISEAAFANALIPVVFPKGLMEDYGVIPTVTGKLAVEAAVALTLKLRPGRTHYIAFENQFSGRLGWAGELSCSKPEQKKDYPHSGITVHHLPFPVTSEDYYRAMNMLNRIPLDSVNAVLCEYVQGEGGINVMNTAHFVELFHFIENHDSYLIFDEIQSGLGRTGRWFSFQHNPGISPDMVIVGKALGAGLPLSAVVYNKKSLFEDKDHYFSVLEHGWLSGTFPGYPAGIASGIVALDIIKEEKLVENARERGNDLAEALNAFCWEFSRAHEAYFKCIQKGMGLMQGLEFRTHDGLRGHPESRDRILNNLPQVKPVGILTLPAGISLLNPTIRFLPPLTITKYEIDYLKEKLLEFA